MPPAKSANNREKSRKRRGKRGKRGLATRADTTEIFRNFSSIFDQKLANVQTQFLETQQQTANMLQTKKIKETQKAKWNLEGNQQQFEHNQQVSAKY